MKLFSVVFFFVTVSHATSLLKYIYIGGVAWYRMMLCRYRYFSTVPGLNPGFPLAFDRKQLKQFSLSCLWYLLDIFWYFGKNLIIYLSI